MSNGLSRAFAIAVGTLTFSVPAVCAATDLTTPKASGLAWRSGASCADADYEEWRGDRSLDVNVVFVPDDSWDIITKRVITPYFKTKIGLSKEIVISLPMMPVTAEKQHAACARGALVGYFRTIGGYLAADPQLAHATVRLGWEFNRGSGSHPWGIDDVSEISNYVACFRREARALKSAAPKIFIEWTNGRFTQMSKNPTAAYPGDDVVDIIGVHWYDNPEYPRQTTQAEWDRQSTMTYAGGPMGIATWLPWALGRGKKLAISEWGVWKSLGAVPPVDAKADDPVYVQNMYKFFKAHARDIAYENYYGCSDRHALFPTTLFPKSSQTYERLWSAGL